MVAFTEDAAKGAADRQTRLKVGVYLTRYFGDVLSSDAIRDIATAFTAEREEHTIMFAATADEIERVYTSGPHSCMAHAASDYASSIHPVRVYAAGDLQVAYIERDGNITARAPGLACKEGGWARLRGRNAAPAAPAPSGIRSRL